MRFSMPQRSPDGVPAIARRFTARGLLLIILSVGLFLMAVHFSNNVLFLISFLMFSLAVVAVITQWRALSGVAAHLIPPPVAAAASPARVRFSMERMTSGLRVETPLGTALSDGGDLMIDLRNPARGHYALTPAKLVARDPFGLFQAARDLSVAEAPPDALLTVYPAPDWAAPAPAGAAANPAATGRARGEMAGLRPYRAGDSPGDVSWRHSARHDGLLVKEYEADPRLGARQYDWASVAGRGTEAALSALSAAVLTSARDGAAVGLDLPGQSIAPGRGPGHLATLLGALAVFRRDG